LAAIVVATSMAFGQTNNSDSDAGGGLVGGLDDWDDSQPIRVADLKSLQKDNNFYNKDYRYTNFEGKRYYDSLGTNAGRYSSGFHDTYFGETQLHFAYPKSGLNVQDGEKLPHLYLSLAMAQEYFRVDAQYMFALAAQETGFGITNNESVSRIDNQMAKISTPMPVNAGGGTYPGEFGVWRVKGADNPSAMTAILSTTQIYQYLFPRRRELISFNGTLWPNLQITDFTTRAARAQAVVGNYYLRGGNTFANTDEEKQNLMNPDYSGLKTIHSAAIVNQMVGAITVNICAYYITAKATDICWGYGLATARDKYLGAAIMSNYYNNWANDSAATTSGKTPMLIMMEDLKNKMNAGNVDNFVGNANASSGFGAFANNTVATIKQLVNASKDFEIGSGANSQIIDFEISLDMLRDMFFGDGGTVETQGTGGILLHFYDLKSPKIQYNNAVDKYKEDSTKIHSVRQTIWDILTEAFEICKGKAPNAAGTGKVGADKISYRYDYLSILRTVKDNVGFSNTPDFMSGSRSIVNGVRNLSKSEEKCSVIPQDTKYAIKYNFDGGNESVINPTKYTAQSANLTLNPTTRNGYDFGGWFASADFNGAAVALIPANSTGNKEFWAKWTFIPYTITYDFNGGVEQEGKQNPLGYNVESNNIIFRHPTKEGWFFAGWYSTADFADGTLMAGIPKGSVGNLELFAKWTAQTDTPPSPIRDRKKSDNKHGILLERSVVSQVARINIKTPEQAQINLAIYDNAGNVLYKTSGKNTDTFVWNLTNAAGRNVANGSYLIVVEARGINGTYAYSAKVGVKK